MQEYLRRILPLLLPLRLPLSVSRRHPEHSEGPPQSPLPLFVFQSLTHPASFVICKT